MSFSRHATVRARQRGALPAQVSALLAHGDMEVRRGSGCYAIWISKRALRQLGPITPEGVPTDRLRGLTVVQSDTEVSVTIFRNDRGKVYRREAPRRMR
jgi:hypothetical protein